MKFTTYGSAIESLVAYIRPAREVVYRNHYSTPSYFRELHYATHYAFQKWCSANGVALDQMNTLRIQLLDHARKYSVRGYMAIECLVTHLPNEFNVRGVWTPI